jgi:hypothetical protein
MGGVVAFEMARQLEGAGHEVECLLLIDAMAPRGTAMCLPVGFVDTIVGPGGLSGLSQADRRRVRAEIERNVALLAKYEGHHYAGTATILRAETPLFEDHPEASGRDWEMWLAGIDALHTVPGDHFGLLSGSQITLTASYARRALRRLPARALPAQATEQPLSIGHTRSNRNVVIAAPRRDRDGVARAELVVDEAHPYFFDHPLDHVSGILMLEGLLQLVEASAASQTELVRHMRVSFPSFCEKHPPAILEVLPAGAGEMRVARAVQAGIPVCAMKILTDGVPSPRSIAPALQTSGSAASAKLLHKTRAANVLIEAWRVASGRAETRLLAPPSGHLLAEGDARHYSPLYALEAVRQLVTGLAHEEYGVPLGWPMNLVGVDLVLDAPIARSASITLTHDIVVLPPPGTSNFFHFGVDLWNGREALGHCRLTAQLLTKEAYAKIRHRGRAPGAAAA